MPRPDRVCRRIGAQGSVRQDATLKLLRSGDALRVPREPRVLNLYVARKFVPPDLPAGHAISEHGMMEEDRRVMHGHNYRLQLCI
jgi:hypothetical protein